MGESKSDSERGIRVFDSKRVDWKMRSGKWNEWKQKGERLTWGRSFNNIFNYI